MPVCKKCYYYIMTDFTNQSAPVIDTFRFSSKCSKYNRNSYKCFEEIYKILYVHWTKCHEKYKETGDMSDRHAGEFKFMVDVTEMVSILYPIFMVDVIHLPDEWLVKLKTPRRRRVSGFLPSPMYFNFLLHTVNFKLCKPHTKDSFNRFIEILFMSSFEENSITGIIPLDTTNPYENNIYQIKLKYTGNVEKTICNSDIINIIQACASTD